MVSPKTIYFQVLIKYSSEHTSATEFIVTQFCLAPTPRFQNREGLTTEDEVGVEDAQGSLIGTLLIVDGGRDHKTERDAGDALQHDQNYDQSQGAFVRYLHKHKTMEFRETWSSDGSTAAATVQTTSRLLLSLTLKVVLKREK